MPLKNEYEDLGSKLGGFLGKQWSRIPMKIRVWAVTASIAALLGWGGSTATGITPMGLIEAPKKIITLLERLDSRMGALERKTDVVIQVVEKIPGYDSAEAKVIEETRTKRKKAKRRRDLFGDPIVDSVEYSSYPAPEVATNPNYRVGL